MKERKITTKQLILCSLFTALTAVGAFMRVPIPVLPFTLQLLFTMLAGLLMGGKLGSISVLVYIALGLLGIPVFTEGGGIGYLLKPTFGYIIGFCLGSLVTGNIAHKEKQPSIKRLLWANFAGLGVVYLMGMVYYYIICNFVINSPIGLWPLFLYCFILAVPGDIFLCFVAAFLAKRLIPIVTPKITAEV